MGEFLIVYAAILLADITLLACGRCWKAFRSGK
jgi:hypothetical protein